MEGERRQLLRKIEYSITYCWGQPSNLLDIFRPEDIERLLSDICMKVIIGAESPYQAFVELVVRSGYKYVPRVDQYGEPLLPRRTTPIHLASKRHDYVLVPPAVVRELFQIYGWDTNYTDESGSTHLYAACQFGLYDVVFGFLELGQDPNCIVEERMGLTALLSAVHFGNTRIAELLLSRGADPTLIHRRGRRRKTILHDSCGRSNGAEFARLFLEIDERTQRPRPQVDARDELGETPLHFALRNQDKEMAEVFLKNGADPNLANAEGYTGLHLICKSFDSNGRHRDFAKQFFDICVEVKRSVQVDAEDQLGRTPLQWAVANIKPLAVAALLDHGAEIARFVFPTEDYFGAIYSSHPNYCPWIKVNFASGVLLAIEYLENAGYELDRSAALTVMKFFPKYGLFEEPADNLERCWRDDEAFASKARNAMILPDLSLYDLIRMRPEVAARRLSYKDYFVSKSLYSFSFERPKVHDAWARHLCEKMSRRFFRNWALESLMELTNYRLPLECCGVIIDKSLTNKDLCNICLATTIQNS